ncbi:hypothetical protein EXS62_01445 [Candidatus Kaiserbacteria bacterium]|nr:hypothetical protein [Candidatus Kaiserbacteria bacterium]
MKILWTLIAVFILTVLAGIAVLVLPGKAPAPAEQPYADLIQPGTPVVTPTTLTINGEARGGWYFEGSFPIELKDAAGVRLVLVPAQAQSDWMTAEWVPFAATLNYPAQPAGSHGTLILRNDNPSGLPQNDKSVSLPVTF